MLFRYNRPAVVLAALLQVLPLVRSFVANPAASSTFAIILRWGIGAGVAVGSVDAVSGATSVFTTPSTFSGTVGNVFSNNVLVSIGGGNTAASSDYFIVTAGTTSSSALANGQATTVGMPPGLTFKPSWVNNSSTIGGVIFGTPTTAGTYPASITCVSPGNAQLAQSITITISGSSLPTAPAITAPPIAASVAAGKTATFTVTASGTAPLAYYWFKNNVPLADGGNVSGSTTTTLTLASVAATDAANYSVLVSNSVGTATSAAVTLTVILPPTITGQPLSQTQAVGGSATFSVSAGGSAPLNYFWLKNGVAVANGTKYSGVNSSNLTVATLTTADVGNFSVIVSNLAGSVTSSTAALTVVSSPTITTPPANVAVVAGSKASFSVTASGSTPLYYQWLKNGTALADGGNISGSAAATLNLSTVSANDAASYSVIVSNALGTVTSPSATLTVAVPPAITASPVGAAILAGSNITFTVSASGTAPLAYQWLKNGAVISGATSATLTLNNVSAADAASYSVAVTNAVGSATSGSATLTVLAPPAIATQPANVSVVQGGNATFTVTASGTAPLSFQWLKNGSVIAGANSNVLNLISVSTNDAASYSVVVTNTVGSIASSSATLTVLVPPTIVNQPVSVTAVAGSNVTFTVTAAGSGTLTYQWQKNGANISGAVNATLTLNNVSATDAANYSVIVANAASAVTSSTAALTVLLAPAITTQPVSVSVVQGSNAMFTVTASGTAPLNFQWLKNGVVIVGANSNVLALAGVSTNDAAGYAVIVTNLVGSIASSSATLTVLVPPAIVTPPTAVSAVVSNSATFKVAASGTAPLVYQWLKNGTAISGANSATLTLANVSAADAASYSVAISNAAGNVTSAAAALTVEFPPTIVTQPVTQFGALGSNVVLSVIASGTGPLSYHWFNAGGALVDGANISGSTSNILTILALTTNGVGNYFVVVSNAFGSATSTSASVTVNASPIITTQPASQYVAVGGNVVFTVAASGTAPFSYQWLKNGAKLANGGGVSGANSSSLTLSKVTTKSGASYSVIVKNTFGSTTSAAAALSVLTPPSIKSGLQIMPVARVTTPSPANLVKAGTNITLSITATGGAPLSYQWFKNGVALVNGGNISGAVTNVLKISSLTTNDSGVYSVVVSNPVGSVSSSSALTVVAPPVITVPPVSEGVIVGNVASFSVVNTGTAPFNYQWYKGIKVVSGATNSTFNIAAVTTNNAGSYFVVITNFAGSVTSTVATLSVWVPPVFTVQATNQTVRTGYTVTLSAAVSGTAPFSYQWLKNGSALADGGNISGSLTSALTVATVTTNDSGVYVLVVTNVAGSATSSNAVLFVRTGGSGGGDGGGTDNLRTINNISSAVVPLPLVIAKIIPNSDGSITLNCSGTTGSNYVVQASADLATWTDISTNAAVAGQWQVTDTARANSRFYRLKSAP